MLLTFPSFVDIVWESLQGNSIHTMAEICPLLKGSEHIGSASLKTFGVLLLTLHVQIYTPLVYIKLALLSQLKKENCKGYLQTGTRVT